MRRTVSTTALLAGAMVASLGLVACGGGEPESETIAKGVKYYVDQDTDKQVHVIEVDLSVASIDVLTPGKIAATKSPSAMAEEAGAVGVINGDFFNNKEDDNVAGYTNAPVGPMISDGKDLKAAVPNKQRMGSPPNGTNTEAAFGVSGTKALLTELDLEATAETPYGTVEIAALNQYAIPDNGIGLFTSDWGASRERAVCGNNKGREAGCSKTVAEVIVKDNLVTKASGSAGEEPLAAGETALVARDDAVKRLRDLSKGDVVTTHHELVSKDATDFTAALGGIPLLDEYAQPRAGLDNADVAPRTVVGYKDGGKTLYMAVIDGGGDSGGATMWFAASYVARKGIKGAMNLDGGGSSLLAAEKEGKMEVRNHPTDFMGERPVANALAVFATPPEDEDDASKLAGRWEYRGEFAADVRTLIIKEDGSVKYYTEGTPVEYTGKLKEPKGKWDYTAVLKPSGEFAEEYDEFALQLTLSDDSKELIAHGEGGETIYSRAGEK